MGEIKKRRVILQQKKNSTVLEKKLYKAELYGIIRGRDRKIRRNELGIMYNSYKNIV